MFVCLCVLKVWFDIYEFQTNREQFNSQTGIPNCPIFLFFLFSSMYRMALYIDFFIVSVHMHSTFPYFIDGYQILVVCILVLFPSLYVSHFLVHVSNQMMNENSTICHIYSAIRLLLYIGAAIKMSSYILSDKNVYRRMTTRFKRT